MENYHNETILAIVAIAITFVLPYLLPQALAVQENDPWKQQLADPLPHPEEHEKWLEHTLELWKNPVFDDETYLNFTITRVTSIASGKNLTSDLSQEIVELMQGLENMRVGKEIRELLYSHSMLEFQNRAKDVLQKIGKEIGAKKNLVGEMNCEWSEKVKERNGAITRLQHLDSDIQAARLQIDRLTGNPEKTLLDVQLFKKEREMQMNVKNWIYMRLPGGVVNDEWCEIQRTDEELRNLSLRLDEETHTKDGRHTLIINLEAEKTIQIMLDTESLVQNMFGKYIIDLQTAVDEFDRPETLENLKAWYNSSRAARGLGPTKHDLQEDIDSTVQRFREHIQHAHECHVCAYSIDQVNKALEKRVAKIASEDAPKKNTTQQEKENFDYSVQVELKKWFYKHFETEQLENDRLDLTRAYDEYTMTGVRLSNVTSSFDDGHVDLVHKVCKRLDELEGVISTLRNKYADDLQRVIDDIEQMCVQSSIAVWYVLLQFDNHIDNGGHDLHGDIDRLLQPFRDHVKFMRQFHATPLTIDLLTQNATVKTRTQSEKDGHALDVLMKNEAGRVEETVQCKMDHFMMEHYEQRLWVLTSICISFFIIIIVETYVALRNGSL